jgi:hypothetical protein
MSFVEVRFPESVAFESLGGPEFSTSIVAMNSGFEQRNICWSQARLSYNIAGGIKTKTQLDDLIKFFMARNGRAIGFRFKDWTDYSVVDESLGTGNGGVNYTRTITKPVSGTVKVYADTVEVTSGWSVSTITGVVTFDTAPANAVVLTADFQFDVPVRFDSDKLDVSLQSLRSGNAKEVRLVEVRV